MINLEFIFITVLCIAASFIIINRDTITNWFKKHFFGKHVDVKYDYVCPRCGSTNLKSIFLMSPVELARPGARKLNELNYRFSKPLLATVLISTGTLATFWQPKNPQVYICLDCDYNGICPEVEINKIDEFKKKLEESKLTKSDKSKT